MIKCERYIIYSEVNNTYLLNGWGETVLCLLVYVTKEPSLTIE